MEKKFDDGGPAFPMVIPDNPELWAKGNVYSGMSLWDYFAAKAMEGIMHALGEGIHPDDVSGMVRDAYMIADAMIAERNKHTHKEEGRG